MRNSKSIIKEVQGDTLTVGNIVVRLGPELYEKFKLISKTNKVSMQKIIRLLVQDFVQDFEDKKSK